MIVLGRIAAPFGIQGWVKVQLFGDDPGALVKIPRWWLAEEEEAVDTSWRPILLAGCKPHGKGVLARFEGIEDRDAAEQLVGLYAGAPRNTLPRTADHEYYWADLIGSTVVNLADERLGRVAGLVRTGAHEVLDVRDEDNRQRLLPFVAAVIKDVDLDGRRIRVDWGRDW